jgi:hypothetical protein
VPACDGAVTDLKDWFAVRIRIRMQPQGQRGARTASKACLAPNFFLRLFVTLNIYTCEY